MLISRRRLIRVRAAFSLLLLLVFIAVQAGVAFASNAGVLSGRITDAATNRNLSGVEVTAASPSGSYHATTDKDGFYSIAGAYADTYTVSFRLSGYEPVAAAGISVYADQVTSLDQALRSAHKAAVKTIALVRSHSTSSAFQPSRTTDTVTLSSPQIQNFQGSSLNFSETNLLTSLPGAMLDSSRYPVIHGAREYESGFEFEGIPYTDAYTNQFNNSLTIPTGAVGLVQLTPGAGDVTQGSSGGFGTFNLVAKRGTYPGFATLEGAAGAPGFDHRLNFDYGWATPDGRWSNYLSIANSNEAFQYGRNTHPYAFIGAFYGTGYQTHREALDNLIYRFGKNNSQSLQAFADIAQHNFYKDAGGITGLCFYSCDLVYTSTWSFIFKMAPDQVTRISGLYPGQPSLIAPLVQASNRAPATFRQPNAAFKFAYTNSFDSSTFLNITAYRTNAVNVYDAPSSNGRFAYDGYALQGGQTSGITALFQKQFNERHLLEFGADVSHLHPVDAYRSESNALFGSFLGKINGFGDQYALPYAFISASDSDGCPLQSEFKLPVGPGTTCGYAYNAFPSATQLNLPMFDQVSSVQRQDYSLYATDTWRPDDRLSAQLGVRLDAATYRMQKPGIDPYYCTTQYVPTAWTPPTTFDAAHGFVCNAKAAFDFPDNAVKPKVWQPRIDLSYKLGNDTAVRLSYNRAVQFVPISSIDYGEVVANSYLASYGGLAPYDPFRGSKDFEGGTHCGIPTTVGGSSLIVPCRNFGEQLYWSNQNFDGIPYQPARPTTSDNYAFTVSHQFTSGWLNGVAISLSPWYRNQHDTTANEASPLLTPAGQPEVVNGVIQFGPPVLTNNGKESASGIDLNLTRQATDRLSGQFTASYINEFSSVIPLISQEDYYPNIAPASIALGNVYRVGFLSPFQTTLGLTYRTPTGWRINPRYTYNIGYPTGAGTLTAAYVNGVPYNLPNTNAVVGSQPVGPACFVDPLDPGSVLAPNEDACRGNSETSSPGGKLTPPQGFLDLTLEYGAPRSNVVYGFNIDNVFNQVYNGAQLNNRYQPLTTGVSGPLTGYSINPVDYTNYPSAWPQYGSFMHGNDVWIDIPNRFGRTFYFYMHVRI